MSNGAVLGRTAELDRIATIIRSIAAGPRALVIDGEAGIGKTAVWSAALADARRESGPGGLTVLSVRAVEAESSLPHVVLTDLFGPIAPAALEGLPGPQAAALAAAMLLDGGRSSDDVADPRAIATGVLGVLQAATRDRPILLAIDDVQWIDPASATALEFALRRAVVGRLPIGLIVTQRFGQDLAESGRPSPRAIAVTALPPTAAVFGEDTERLTIGPVSLGVLHQIIRQRTGAALTRPRLVRLEEASGGNPLLAIEIGRELARLDRWPLPGEPLPVPADLHALIAQRLARLSPGGIDTLFVAAAMNAPTISRVAAVLELPTDVIRDAVWQAAGGGLLGPGVDHELRFVHPTIEAAALDGPTPARRRTLRARLAAEATTDEDRGRHVALAADGPDPVAAKTLDAAAEAARRRGAPAVAAAWADLAAEPGGRWTVRLARARHLVEVARGFWVQAARPREVQGVELADDDGHDRPQPLRGPGRQPERPAGFQ